MAGTDYFGCKVCCIRGVPFTSLTLKSHLRTKGHKFMKILSENDIWPETVDRIGGGDKGPQYYRFMDTHGSAILCAPCNKVTSGTAALFEHQLDDSHRNTVTNKSLNLPTIFYCEPCETMICGLQNYYNHCFSDEHNTGNVAKSRESATDSNETNSAKKASTRSSRSAASIDRHKTSDQKSRPSSRRIWSSKRDRLSPDSKGDKSSRYSDRAKSVQVPNRSSIDKESINPDSTDNNSNYNNNELDDLKKSIKLISAREDSSFGDLLQNFMTRLNEKKASIGKSEAATTSAATSKEDSRFGRKIDINQQVNLKASDRTINQSEPDQNTKFQIIPDSNSNIELTNKEPEVKTVASNSDAFEKLLKLVGVERKLAEKADETASAKNDYFDDATNVATLSGILAKLRQNEPKDSPCSISNTTKPQNPIKRAIAVAENQFKPDHLSPGTAAIPSDRNETALLADCQQFESNPFNQTEAASQISPPQMSGCDSVGNRSSLTVIERLAAIAGVKLPPLSVDDVSDGDDSPTSTAAVDLLIGQLNAYVDAEAARIKERLLALRQVERTRDALLQRQMDRQRDALIEKSPAASPPPQQPQPAKAVTEVVPSDPLAADATESPSPPPPPQADALRALLYKLAMQQSAADAPTSITAAETTRSSPPPHRRLHLDVETSPSAGRDANIIPPLRSLMEKMAAKRAAAVDAASSGDEDVVGGDVTPPSFALMAVLRKLRNGDVGGATTAAMTSEVVVAAGGDKSAAAAKRLAAKTTSASAERSSGAKSSAKRSRR